MKSYKNKMNLLKESNQILFQIFNIYRNFLFYFLFIKEKKKVKCKILIKIIVN